MRRKIVTVLAVILTTATGAQNVTTEMISLTLDSARSFQYSDFDRAVRLTYKADALIRRARESGFAKESVRAFQIRIQAGRYFLHYPFVRKNLDSAQALIELEKVNLGPQYQVLRINNELSLAKYYQETGNYSKALKQFSVSMDELKSLPQTKENCRDLQNASQYVAGIHAAQGEFDAAINQFIASISYFPCFLEPNRRGQSYALTYRNIAQSFLGKHDFENARYYLDHAEDSIKPVLQQDPFLASGSTITIYESQAIYFNAISRPDSALIALQKAVPLLAYSEPFSGRVYLGLAAAFRQVRDFKSAQVYCGKAEAFFKNAGGQNNLSLANTYLSWGELHEAQGSLEKSLEAYQESMANLVIDFSGSGSLQDPPLKNILSKKALFSVLKRKSNLLQKMYRQNGDTSLLAQAWKTNATAIALLDSTSREFSLNSDKVILAEQSFGAFETGIRIGASLQEEAQEYFDACFSLSEKSKGIVLLENLRLVNNFAGVNPELLDEEKTIKSDLIQTEQSLYQEELKDRHSEKLIGIRQRYASLKEDYSEWLEHVKKEAPQYYQLRFDHRVITPARIQTEILEEGEAMIEYFLGDSTLTTFTFTRASQFISHKKLPDGFGDKVRQWREMLVVPGTTDSKKDLTELSGYMYDHILKESIDKLDAGIRALIIVPDGVLGYLPFEIMTASTDPADYLINRFSIRYAYSATYLMEQLQKEPSHAANFFAGFVAGGGETTAETRGEGTLAGAHLEVNTITDLLKTGCTVYDPAFKRDFLQQAAGFRVLHLAMHSVVNDQNPMLSELIFSNEGNPDYKLTAIELYNMQLGADMAVLSACNTGFGELRRGEGIMSLSRAFAYAGVPSAVISLWKVPDFATSKVMVLYYKYLGAGLYKDRALQLAKSDFVEQNPEMADPFYWSGFILSGNNRPLEFPTSKMWLWLVGIAVLAALVAMLIKRSRTHSAPNAFLM